MDIMDFIAQGAEATLTKTATGVLKQRTPKTYRHPQLDASLRHSRNKREIKALKKAKEAGVRVPEILEEQEHSFLMEYIAAPPLREVLLNQPERYDLLEQLGRMIARLHNAELIHGDLTTSNVLVADELVIIDFGLSFFSRRIEDMAVDLHVLEQIIESSHPTYKQELFNAVLTGYLDVQHHAQVLERLAIVQQRGRNK